EGTPREVHGLEAMGTTCNYDVPHYEIRADRTTIRPGRRAIFRKASLSIKGRTILKVPYLSVPLNEPNTQYLPQVGHSPIEGNFVKSRTGLSLPSDREALDARVDEFSKLGPALGADFKYGPNERNLLSLYGLPGGPRSLLLDSHHHQSLGKLDVTFDNNYRRHDYLSDPLGTRWTSRAVASLASRAAKTRLTLNRSTSDSVGFHSVQQNLGLDDSRTYGRRFKTDLSTNWTRLDSQVVGSDLVERQRIDLKVTAQEDLDRATAEVLYQRSIPVGETSNFFNAADRTPVVRLFSDGRRLFGPRVGERFPVKAELSTGQFADPNQPNRIQRNAFEITMQKGAPTERRFKLNVDGRFRQGFYSDDTAQFVAGAGLQASYRFIKDGSVNLRYNYLRPQGFSPLSIDQTGRTDQFTGDLSFKLGHAISLGAQTGYDVLQGKLGNEAWQQVGVRAEYVPRKEFAIRTLASYDTIAHAWSNARMDFSMQRGPTFVAIGTRYDGLRHVWGAENAYIRSLRWGRVSADARIAYNGYLKKYEAQQYGLVYDLHDAEAIFQLIDNGTGLRTGKQIAIFLRLKALPFNSLFGTGGLGQPLGTGTGRDF
ncbi:MAG: hypothetical protein HY248_04615, partial [Fimbriimonas ginsengisoli]|nr:hypothetical protein [Fimbriimonas ginsengisoli]